ncbi:MAG: hypothetical protein RR135_02325, partial [Oscillospiraceae bacterium]
MRLSTTPSQYSCTLDDLLRLAVERRGSDLHLVVGMPPCVRIDGEMLLMDHL